MHIKQRIGLLAALAAAAVIMTTALAFSPEPKESTMPQTEETAFRQTLPPQAQETPETAAVKICYWVHEQDGVIAVYDSDDRTLPLTLTGISLHTLREADRNMILGGVLIEGEENLQHFLEGFTA